MDSCLTRSSSDSWNASIAVSGLNIHTVWQDGRDGNYEIYYKRKVVEVGGRGSEGKIYALPNPFSTYTWILGHEQEDFCVFNVLGRLVGAYKGDQVGGDLPSGVYFLRGGDGLPLVRIVKVR